MKTGPILVGMLVTATALLALAPPAAAGSGCDIFWTVHKVTGQIPLVQFAQNEDARSVLIGVPTEDNAWGAEFGTDCGGIVDQILDCIDLGIDEFEAFKICVG